MLELPKLPKEWKEDSGNILLWAKFINAEKKEEFEMLAKKDPYINSAYQHLQIISQDQQKRAEYEAREKAIRDHVQMMMESREEGRAEGRAEGEQRIIRLLLETMPLEQVAQMLKIPAGDIQQIANT